MEIAGILLLFGVVFGGILYWRIRRVWLMYRVIAIALPSGNDTQAFGFKLTESLRTLGYKEAPQTGPARIFRGQAWMRWAVGLQDISVEPAGAGMLVITGPACKISVLGKLYSGAAPRPYHGSQPVWPLLRGFIRLMAVCLGLFLATFVPFYFFGMK